jgi:glycosyltransferase involved in cell wall biosynthesis
MGTAGGETGERMTLERGRRGGPFTVLYVEGSASTAELVGGSIVSLYTLVRSLDRTFIRPVVLFTNPNRFVRQFEEAGVEVQVLHQKTIRERATAKSLSSALQSAAPRATPLRRAYEAGALAFRLFFEFLPRALSVYREIRRSRAALIHANDRTGSNQFVILAARMAGIPCVVHERMISAFGPFERMLSRWTRVSICISEDLRAQCQAAGLQTGDVRVIPNAVDTQAALEAAATAPPRDPGAPSIVLVGRLVPWKGQLVFLEALALARREIPGLRASLVGGADPSQRSYVQEIERGIERLGLSEAVTLTGAVDDVLQRIAAADLLVHASTDPEPFGRVIIEAMAVGRPVIATAHGAPLEIVKDGENGLLVPPGDPQALSGAILRVLRDPEESARLCRAGREAASRQYGIEAHRKGIEKVYRDIIEKA